MRCTNYDVSKLPDKQPPSPAYNIHYYCLPLMQEDVYIANKKISIVKRAGTVGKARMFVEGVGEIKPVINASDICLGGLRRSITSYYSKNKYTPQYSYIIAEFGSKHKKLSKDTVNRYYDIVRKMGLVSDLTNKADFTKYMITAVNAEIHSMVYLYVTMSVLRSLRDDHIFVKYFVDAVDKGIDPYAAYVAMSMVAHNSGHHIVNRPYSFGSLDWDETLSPAWIGGIYKLFKLKKHKELKPINVNGYGGFSVHDTILKYGRKRIFLNKVKAKSLLQYGNTLAASIKLTHTKATPTSTIRIIDKIRKIGK